MTEPSWFIVFLRKAPFVRLVVPLLLGITCAEYHFIPLPVSSLWLCGFSITACLLLFFIPFKPYYNLRWLWGTLLFLAVFFAGHSLIDSQKRVSELPIGKEILLRGVVIENPVQKPKSKQLVVRATAYKVYGSWLNSNEKVILYVAPSVTSDSLKAGQLLVVKTTLQRIAPPSNPEEFDYQTYMRRKGFFTTAFVRNGSYEVLAEKGLSAFQQVPLVLQQKLARCFGTSGIQGQELAVLMALTIGDKQLLDKDLIEAYSTAGVIHVLSVSGLHVGLLFALLSLSFSFLDRRKGGRAARILLSIALLWFYAALAGFAPSVIRATVMFSIVLLGQLSGRKAISINSLAAAAFFTCLFSPYSVFSIGFQLSYMAVLGIAVFYPYLRNLLYVRNRILRGAWQLCCVSVAAQLATTPLTIFYFHQLPVYFLPANVMVIPLVSLATYLIVGLILASWIPVLSTAIGYVLNLCIQLLNYVVVAVQQLPYSLMDDVYLGSFQLALLLASMVSLAIVAYNRKRLYGLLTIGFFALVISLGFSHRIQTGEQKLIAVCSVSNATFIAFVNGHNAVCVRDSSSMQANFDYNLKACFTKWGLRLSDIPVMKCGAPDLQNGVVKCYKNFLLFSGHAVKILCGGDNLASISEPTPVDYLIVTGSFKKPPHLALACYTPKQVILDSSVKNRQQKLWINELTKQNIPFHNVAEEGAFISDES